MTRQTLKGHLQAYLSLREALGFQRQAERVLLLDFIDFVIEHGDGGSIRAQWAMDWVWRISSSRGGRGAAVQRLQTVRQFLTYLRAIAPDTGVPEPGLITKQRPSRPFLFTQQQIACLIGAAHQARPRNSLRPHTLTTLLGLLASTGLRTGEALRLTMTDVELDHTPPRLQIRETKFHKTRLVPLHASTAEQLRTYSARRIWPRYNNDLSDTFLLSARGQPLDYSSLQRWLRRCCQQLNIKPTEPNQRRPCLRSFRHSFAVERLRRWNQAGQDVRTLLPQLSIYLGHLGPDETYWYLTATPELLAAATERFERFAAIGEAP